MARESDVLRALLRPRPAHERARLLPGEDAAPIADGAGELVVTTDALEEDVHFRAGWLGLEDLAWKLLAIHLSDLAAAGAEPVGYLMTLAWPDRRPAADAERLGAALREAETAWRCPLLGGDTDLTPGPLRLGATAFGRRARPVTRGAARAGDALFVTGPLGGAAAVVARLLDGHDVPEAPEWEDARRRFARPVPRLDVMRLASGRVRAAIDLSDGLRADSARLAEASGLAAVIDERLVPRHAAASMEQALEGGEDYELLLAGDDDLGALHPDLVRIGRLD